MIARTVVAFFALFLCSKSAIALVILQYHHISKDTPPSTSTSPERFERHLELIEQAKFRVISLEDFAALRRAGAELPENTVVITFDDGFSSIYDSAFPLLKKRAWPFTVFINTKPHDDKLGSHMSWQQLKELQNYGATIANHGVTHAHILRHEGDAEHYFQTEIAAAEKRLVEKLGKSHKLFAYPYGEYDQAIIERLKKQGYLGFAQNSGAVARDSDPQQIPRFPFGGDFGDDQDFSLKLATLAIQGQREQALDEVRRTISSPLLALDVERPIWQISLPAQFSNLQFNCFASGQGLISVVREESHYYVQANKKINLGRSKYNCTARSTSGRFFWLSKLWIRKDKKGHWRHD